MFFDRLSLLFYKIKVNDKMCIIIHPFHTHSVLPTIIMNIPDYYLLVRILCIKTH